MEGAKGRSDKKDICVYNRKMIEFVFIICMGDNAKNRLARAKRSVLNEKEEV